MTPAEEILKKALLPTPLNSAEIRTQIAKEILRRSVFTARCEEERFLAALRQAAGGFVGGTTDPRTAIKGLQTLLDDLGYDAEKGGWVNDPYNDGAPLTGLANLRGVKRLELILHTQTQMATSAARMRFETPDTRYTWPAWRLERSKLARLDSKGRSTERDWASRWQDAAEYVDYEGVALNGEMVALKGSPVWQALGDGAGGYADTLGQDMPPFAFNSGMILMPVTREACEALGLDPDGAEPMDPTLEPSAMEVRRAAERYGQAFMDQLFDDLDRGAW